MALALWTFRTPTKPMISLTKSRIAVIPIEDPDKIGHIYIPDSAKQRVDNGIIKYRGPEATLPVGTHIIFSGYSGDLVTIAGEGPLFLMDESDALAILTDDPPRELFTLDHIEHAIEIFNSKHLDQIPAESLLDILRSRTFADGFQF